MPPQEDSTRTPASPSAPHGTSRWHLCLPSPQTRAAVSSGEGRAAGPPARTGVGCSLERAGSELPEWRPGTADGGNVRPSWGEVSGRGGRAASHRPHALTCGAPGLVPGRNGQARWKTASSAPDLPPPHRWAGSPEPEEPDENQEHSEGAPVPAILPPRERLQGRKGGPGEQSTGTHWGTDQRPADTLQQESDSPRRWKALPSHRPAKHGAARLTPQTAVQRAGDRPESPGSPRESGDRGGQRSHTGKQRGTACSDRRTPAGTWWCQDHAPRVPNPKA